ncbi:MAG: hypothetical protein Tsb0034_22860 [Ekhidna sp.]
MRKLLLLIWFITLLLSGCSQSQKDTEDPKKTTHLLFVGNSLTYYNDLPGLVKQEAKQKGIKVKTKQLAYPNYAIEDHLNDGEVQQLLKKEVYDYVIIQQGPSSQAEGRRMLFESGGILKKLCSESGAELVYYMVWPSRTYYHTFDGVIKNHREAAKANDALLCPVGEVWKAHFDKTGDFSYYGPDGFHPSMKGSEVAAEVIVQTLFK